MYTYLLLIKSAIMLTFVTYGSQDTVYLYWYMIDITIIWRKILGILRQDLL